MSNGEGEDRGPLPSQTLEAVAKTMVRQAREYGFSREDFVRFVNLLLDLAFEDKEGYIPPAVNRDGAEPGENPPDDFSIEAKRVNIRRYRDEDYPLLEKWVSDPEGRLFLLTRTSSGAPDDLKTLLASPSSVFGIVNLEQEPIGALAYLDLDPVQGKAELRKLIGEPQARGRGFAAEATRFWVEFGLTTLGLRKIYVHTLDTNLANIRLNERLGFRVEGLLREECYFDGEFHDLLRMSLVVPR